MCKNDVEQQAFFTVMNFTLQELTTILQERTFIFHKHVILFNIFGFHSSDYEECHLLGCDTV
jgi:intracellular septation protein A